MAEFFEEYGEDLVQKIGIPLLIYGAFSFFTKRSTTPTSSTSSSLDAKQRAAELERRRKSLESSSQSISDSSLVQVVYGLTICYFLFKALVIDYSFYSFFDIPVETKSYIVSAFCSNTLIQKGLMLPSSSLDGVDAYTKRMIDLCNGVLSDANIIVMQSLGEYALLECSWCREHQDYFVFSLAYVLGYYIWFMVVVGLLTASDKMYTWRYITLAASTTMLLMEIGFRMTENSAISFTEDWGFLAFETQHILLQRLRCFLLSISLIFLSFTSSKTTREWTEKDLLKTMINATIQSHSRNTCIDAIDTVVFKDEPLSVLHKRYHSEANELAKVFHKLPETKDIKRNLLLKHNMPVIRSTAKNWVNSILSLIPPTLAAGKVENETDTAANLDPWTQFDE